jgi:hypothetical protein
MRRFDDGRGTAWEVVLGRESWGSLFAIFIPVEAGTGAEMRQAPISASSPEEATMVFDAMDEAGLCALLERSEPKVL